MIAKSKDDWTKTDKRYGWKFGCDGVVNATEAGKIVGVSAGQMSRILKSLDSRSSSPSDKTWPLRAGKPELYGEIHSCPWEVCVRSLNEYKKRLEPVEV